uniref:Uncharacterized protein n=1 Tax=Tanacetum cinerariifolium TaxID=118510 RepID=A0A6L2KUC1_TANCI|nr:hypothetical protein [Tanacetum cinerariifolium]
MEGFIFINSIPFSIQSSICLKYNLPLQPRWENDPGKLFTAPDSLRGWASKLDGGEASNRDRGEASNSTEVGHGRRRGLQPLGGYVIYPYENDKLSTRVTVMLVNRTQEIRLCGSSDGPKLCNCGDRDAYNTIILDYAGRGNALGYALQSS